MDEGVSWELSREGNALSVIHAALGDRHVPLHYLILHFMMIFGESEFILRFPSAIFGILMIPLIYKTGEYFFGKNEGLISAFLLSISLMHLYYSQEARMYSQLAFFSLASLYFFYRAMMENRKGLWAGFVVSILLCFYSHMYAIFVLGILALFYLLTQFQLSPSKNLRIEAKDVKNARMFLLSLAAIFLLLLPIIPHIYRVGKTAGGIPWGIAPSINFVPIILTQFSTWNMATSCLFIIFFLCGVVASLNVHKEQIALLGLWFALPIAVSYISAGSMPFQVRYIIFVLPVYLILISKGITSVSKILYPTGKKPIPKGRRKERRERKRKEKTASGQAMLVVAILLLFSLASFHPLQGYYATNQKTDLRATATYIESHSHSGDVVAPLPGYIARPLRYYYDNSTDGTILIEATPTTASDLTDFIARYDRVWFVLTADIYATGRGGEVINWLESNSRLEKQYAGVYILLSE